MLLFFFIFCLVFLYNCIIYRKTLRLKLQNGSEKTIISNNLFPILILLLLTQQILKTYTYHLFNLTFSSISSRRSLITYLHIIIYHQKKKKKVLKVLYFQYLSFFCVNAKELHSVVYASDYTNQRNAFLNIGDSVEETSKKLDDITKKQKTIAE